MNFGRSSQQALEIITGNELKTPCWEWMNRGVIDMDLHFAFLHSAVQKIGEWGTQPPSGFLPLDSFAGMSLIAETETPGASAALNAEAPKQAPAELPT